MDILSFSKWAVDCLSLEMPCDKDGFDGSGTHFTDKTGVNYNGVKLCWPAKRILYGKNE